MSIDYKQFIELKQQCGGDHGFDPIFMPDWLFDFQKSLVGWAIRKGRAAIFADCGLGKGPMQLVWAENIVRKTGKRVLIVTPLAVSYQFIHEGEKFGIDCQRSTNGKPSSAITITNYERLHNFDRDDFIAVACDESSILKNFGGATKAVVTEFTRKMPYRLLCTATAAPNDYYELGTSSEALGYLGYQDMLTKFFKEDTVKDYLGWGRKTYRFRGHAEESFWRWVCSWARVCRKPSDLGFDDGSYILPALIEREHRVETKKPRDGFLFAIPAMDLQEQRQERKNTIEERCELAASFATKHEGQSILWCHLNKEGDVLEKMIDDATQVSGSMVDEEKERRLLAFQSGEIRRLVVKPKIACFGLNFQNCHNVITFPSHSYEQYYQAVRRCWRFGQKKPVTVNIVSSEGEAAVLANLKRKSDQADKMFESLSKHANEALHLEKINPFIRKEEIPSWL